MILILSFAVAVLFGAGAYLLLKHDLLRVIAGIVLIGNAANLFIMSAALTRGSAPLYPLTDPRTTSDPLVQAMTLTAIVISFGVSALLLGLTYLVYVAHLSVDMDQLSSAEEEQAGVDDELAAVARMPADADEDEAVAIAMTEEPR